jgi:hypothetical protein
MPMPAAQPLDSLSEILRSHTRHHESFGHGWVIWNAFYHFLEDFGGIYSVSCSCTPPPDSNPHLDSSIST